MVWMVAGRRGELPTCRPPDGFGLSGWAASASSRGRTRGRSAGDAHAVERGEAVSNLWRAVLFLHLLAMAFFVGGQLVLAAAVVPVARPSGDLTQVRCVCQWSGI